jgi:hypothetical protein
VSPGVKSLNDRAPQVGSSRATNLGDLRADIALRTGPVPRHANAPTSAKCEDAGE